jgi:hypothetical protein
MNATQHAPTRSLGAALERDRLERRARRMTFAVVSLRQRATASERELRATPRHLQKIIVDFEAQIEAMNARLRELAWERTSTEIQRLSSSDEHGH